MAIASDDALGGLASALCRLLAEALEVRKLGPDEQAEPIADIVIDRIGHLDVAAHGVEAELLGLPHLVFEIFGVGQRVEPFRIIILIERAAHVDLLPVEEELAVARLDRAEAEVERIGVEQLAAALQIDDEAVEVGVIGRPRNGVADLEYHPLRHAVAAAMLVRQHLMPFGPEHAQLQSEVSGIGRDGDIDVDLTRA